MQFQLEDFNVVEFDRILSCGLSKGLGTRGQQVCIEAAICQVLDLSHSDDPGCVSAPVRAFKICLNDAAWSSPKARAAGLRDLGLAQLGSLGTIDDQEFAKRLSEKIIRILIPTVFRDLFPDNKKCLAAADRCEKEGTQAAVRAAERAARGTGAAEAAAWAAREAERAARVEAWAAAWAARAADKYLILVANLALEVLRELKSPGVELLKQ